MPRNVTQDNRLETEYHDFLLSAAILRVGWSQVNRSATMDSCEYRPGHIWYDGALVPWKDATLHVLSHALHYASCMFEGERVYNGRIFKLTEHTERLVAGARTMDFEIPWSVAEIDAACNEVVAAQGISEGYVRPVAWRGAEMTGVSAQNTKIHFAETGRAHV